MINLQPQALDKLARLGPHGEEALDTFMQADLDNLRDPISFFVSIIVKLMNRVDGGKVCLHPCLLVHVYVLGGFLFGVGAGGGVCVPVCVRVCAVLSAFFFRKTSAAVVLLELAC